MLYYKSIYHHWFKNTRFYLIFNVYVQLSVVMYICCVYFHLRRLYAKVSRNFRLNERRKQRATTFICKQNWDIHIEISHTYSNLRKFPIGIGVPQQQGNGKSTRKNYNVACVLRIYLQVDGECMMMCLTLCVTHNVKKKRFSLLIYTRST